MFSALPDHHRRLVKATLSAAWVSSAGAGLAAVVLPTVSVDPLGVIGTGIAGATLAVATVLAALGVALNRYQWEWVASWLASASLIPYLVTLWAMTFVSSSNLGQAFLITSLMLFYATRSLLCAAHAAKLREIHVVATAAIESVEGSPANDDGHTSGDDR